MNTQTMIDAYSPARASDRTERERLLADVRDLEKRFRDAQSRSEIAPDPSYARLAHRLDKELNAARQRVATFDRKHEELDARRSSTDAKAAAVRAGKAAEKFERALLAAANAAAELKETAATLADELQVRDPGVWPSKGAVDTAVRSRVIHVLGSVAGIKLPGYGSVGRAAEPLAKRFSTE